MEIITFAIDNFTQGDPNMAKTANEKYEILKKKSITIFGKKLFRIKAKMSFGNVKKNEEGGFIESEKNLSVFGDAWVSGNARVSGNAKITNTVINLIGVCDFNITMYGKFLQIGCFLHTFKEWEKIYKNNKYKNQTSPEDYKRCKKAYLFCRSIYKQNQ